MAHPEIRAGGAPGARETYEPPREPGHPIRSGVRVDPGAASARWPLEVWIPGRLEHFKNRRRHWRVVSAYTRRWKLASWSHVTRALGRGAVDPTTPKRVMFRAVVGGYWDGDNLRLGCAPARDGLVRAGVLDDDNELRTGHAFDYAIEAITRDRTRWGLRITVTLAARA